MAVATRLRTAPPAASEPPLAWPAAVAGGVLCGLFGAAAVALAAGAALGLWLLARAIPRGRVVVPGAIATWCAAMALLVA